MHRHLNEELSTVSREEELLGKAGACRFHGLLFARGRRVPLGGAVPGPWPCSESLPGVPESRVARKAKRSAPPRPQLPISLVSAKGCGREGEPLLASSIIFLFTRVVSIRLWIVFFPSLFYSF